MVGRAIPDIQGLAVSQAIQVTAESQVTPDIQESVDFQVLSVLAVHKVIGDLFGQHLAKLPQLPILHMPSL